MKMFLGQFFSKARWGLAGGTEEESYYPDDCLGNPDSTFSRSGMCYSFMTNFMWVLGSKLKITQIKQLSRASLSYYATFHKLRKSPGTFLNPFGDVILTTTIQEYIIKSNKSSMSNSDNPNPYLLNRYGGTPSRMTRTNINNAPNRPTSQPRNQLKQPLASQTSVKVEQSNDVFKNLLPKKVSELSSNVLFQGMDKQDQSAKPYGPIKRSQRPLQRKVEPPPAPVIDQRTSMGVLTNAFMGATTKYQKMKVDPNMSTPSKGEGSQPKSPRHSETSSQPGGIRFARRKNQEQKIESIDLSAQSSPRKQKEDTDSNVGSSKKIQRKPIGARQLLKHYEKKDTDRSEDKSENQHSRIGSQNKSQTSIDNPTNITEQASEPSQIKPPVAQRQYRPIQRQNQSQIKPLVKESQDNISQVAANSEIKRIYPIKQQSIKSQIVPTTPEPSDQVVEKHQTIQRRPYQNRGIAMNKPASEVTPTKVQEPPVQEQQQTPKQSLSRINRYGGSKPAQPQLNTKEQSANGEVKEAEKSQQGSRVVTPNKQVSGAPSPLSKRGKRQSEAGSLAESKATERIILKKTSVLCFILKRIFASQLTSSYFIFKKQMTSIKIKLTAEAGILASCCCSIVKYKEQNSVKMAFDQLRKKFMASYSQEVKPMLTAKVGNPSLSGLNIIHSLVYSKIRSAFRCLNNKFVISNKIKGIIHLQKLVKHKQQSLQHLSLNQMKRTSQNKIAYFDEFFMILRKYWKNELLRGFAAIQSVHKNKSVQQTTQRPSKQRGVRPPPSLHEQEHVKEQPDPILVQKSQKLQAISDSLKDNISIIENKVETAKSEQGEAKEQLQYKISVLKQQNSQFQLQLTNKRNRNDEISKQIINLANTKTEHEQIQEAFEPPSQKLETLTNIYIGAYKEQNIKREEFLSQYNLEAQDSNSLVNQWALLRKNTELKKIIGRYEHADQVESKARRTVMNEQQMVLKLVRSYIKEQYFWQWLHTSVQSI